MIPLLQIENPVTDTIVRTISSPATAEPVSPPSFWELAQYGGPIIYILLALSVIAIYLFVRKLLQIHAAGKEGDAFMERIKDYLHDGKLDSAINLCQSTNTPSARMIEKGLSRLGRPMNDILVAIENVGNIEVGKLENGMPVLASIAAVAPMIGFLGTVTGMIESFYNMSSAAAGGADISMLAGGIYQALVTTVGGLIVGIIVLFGYNYLVALTDKVVNKMETKTLEFMDLINERV
ncbi:MotA/TolQ/ExbB proton channel family protein [Porphyromonas crevioricanis]|uniref:MotA/TolQ/ExbB proton channel family protein n=1 Tax=Porphyromonas crevioricanis JCM 15906 TaxID=1305617 RepID=T1DQC3_9PORP|nr:MotA/TolQ/ExbB proton channel family protein [Porphyromonas crevioricanis]GAD04660.1 MotA/TolQ/ExbB proton channel family protein [Porphyromonas crevioricanis JCM 15906]SJZ67001.1 biopolymer transport protein ExbB [Porphyromonas crevioricanis]